MTNHDREERNVSKAAPMTVNDFTRRMDALVAEFAAGAAACGDTNAGAVRSPRASWCLAMSHAEHRVHSLNRAAGAEVGRA